VLAPAAAAHVEVTPARVGPARIDPGAEAQLTFSVPNEGSTAITRVSIGLPPDLDLGQIGQRAGWTVMRSPHLAAWRGGSIKPGELATFQITITAPRQVERALFTVLLSHAGGRTDTYRPGLMIARAPTTHDAGARRLAEAALIVALVAVVLALGGGFLALWLWLRPRPPDRF
jgi:hypothetical protein